MKIVSCQTTDSKPVKQEVNRTVILPPLVFLASTLLTWLGMLDIDKHKPFLLNS
jgi:hypothetical protein